MQKCRNMRRTLSMIIMLFACIFSRAASVDTATIFSLSMHKNIKCVIITPDAYKSKQSRFPVVYLLHGYSDRYNAWIRQVPAIRGYADQMQLIIVCPDGGFSSWYFDSPIDSSYKYDTHVSMEVVGYVDAHYRTVANRGHRAITGLSMGGHGALYLALRHPGVFGAAGSMSGGVDLRPFPDEWDIAKRIGDAKTYSRNWERMSVAGMVGLNPSQAPAMMIECGTDDFFYKVNLQLHYKLLELRIPHDYVERPGKHTWGYWENAIEYQLLFFKKYFDKQGPIK